MRCFAGWNWDFRLVPTSRGIRPPTIFLACKLREKSSIVELVLRLSEYNNHLNRVGVDLPDKIVMFLRSHYHQAARASWWTIISGTYMMILEIFAMFDTTKVEIKKEHQLLMVGETTSFKKGKGKKGYFMKRQISCCSSEETQGWTQTRD